MTSLTGQSVRRFAHRTARRRLAGICLLAATAFTVALPIRAVAASDEASAPAAIVPVDWSDTGWSDTGWGGAGWGGAGWGDGSTGRGAGDWGGQSGDQRFGDQQSGSQLATVDSETASKAESRGVVLIDTVLSDGEGAGTGMVLTSSGEIVTNYHVVEGATTITVTVASTGRTYAATVLGTDPSADVALLKLKDASGLDTVRIDDDSVAVGDEVTAVGNAGGTGTLTAAAGNVTALKATITTASEGSVEGETLQSLIETDADVVAGDSGGPLIDDEGEVVGMDTAASTGDEIDGYAIPIQAALKVVEQIRSGEETSTVRIGSSGYLGVELAAGNGEQSGSGWNTQEPSADTAGAEIAGVVDGGAAAQAGLEAGDVITRVDGRAITSADELAAVIGDHDAGDKITIHWLDVSGDAHTVTVTLGANPAA